jgi:hypothetical protein
VELMMAGAAFTASRARRTSRAGTHPGRELRASFAGALLVCAFAGGCRCSEGAAPKPAPAPASDVTLCARGPGQLTLSPSDASQDGKWGDVTDLPFAVEVGVGAVHGRDFYVTALRSEARGASELLARLGAGAQESELIELGRVQGDAAPARIAARGSDVIAALLEPAAGQRKLRLGRVQRDVLPTVVRWGAELPQGNDESSAFDLALGEGRVVVAWDDWNAAGKHGEIRSASLALEALEVPPAEMPIVSAAGHDAEAPRLAVRPGGYWLAWLVGSARPGAVTAAPPGPGTDEAAGADPLLSGERWIELLALDAAGVAAGKVARVTRGGGRVLGFDLTAGPDGNAWLVWREDAVSVLAPGGSVVLGVVRDGVTTEHVIDDQEVGAGVPSWLPSDAALAKRWLSFAGKGDLARVFPIERPGETPPALTLGRSLRDATPLAVNAPDIVFAAPRARSIELSVATCRPLGADAGAR